MTSPTPSAEPAYADRTYRSSAGIAGGALLLALTLWLGIDAVFQGHGNAPWLALAMLLCVVPLIVAFSLRPAVFASADRLLVRNPFRTITLPWACVADVRAGYSSEAIDRSNHKYQLWAIPVSLRRRKRAARVQARDAAVGGRSGLSVTADVTDDKARIAPADQSVRDLRDLAEQGATRESAQGAVSIRWAYEVIAPALVGALLFFVLLAIG
ncbi:PH domain-containing protein [Streptomyces sp. NPDC048416]|uniref:PH domain-containing protein n=1 Tax=Streptomyces sp. NPDC048416 TaxID=3365546 RepID=UPI003715145D